MSLERKLLTELDKAQAYIIDKNNSIQRTVEATGIPRTTLDVYRKDPDKLKTAAWIRVHMLAQEYDKKADS